MIPDVLRLLARILGSEVFGLIASLLFTFFAERITTFLTQHGVKLRRFAALAAFSAMVGGAITLTQFYDVASAAKFLPTTEEMRRMFFNPYILFPGIIIALALYRLRGTHPVAYGLLEVIVGIFSMWFAVLPRPDMLTTDSVPAQNAIMPPTNELANVLGFLGGLYIVIRGLDNMDKGVSGRLRRIWNLAFPKRQPTAPGTGGIK